MTIDHFNSPEFHMIRAGKIGFHGLFRAGAGRNGRLVLLGRGLLIGRNERFGGLRWCHSCRMRWVGVDERVWLTNFANKLGNVLRRLS